MKNIGTLLSAALCVTPAGETMAAPPVLSAFYCPPCPVQTKTPSRKSPGQFDYKLKCMDKDSGNSVVLDITARNDSEALHTAWKSPRLDEAIVGMEANGYACAEPPPRSK